MRWLLLLVFLLLVLSLVFMFAFFIASRPAPPTRRQWRDVVVGLVILIVLVTAFTLGLYYAGDRAEGAFFVVCAVFLTVVGCWMLLTALLRSRGWDTSSKWWPSTAVGGLLFGIGMLLWALNFVASIENWTTFGVPGLGGVVGEFAGLWVERRAKNRAEGG
jgi:hypothetical protein